jgi:hypothetical protein
MKNKYVIGGVILAALYLGWMMHVPENSVRIGDGIVRTFDEENSVACYRVNYSVSCVYLLDKAIISAVTKVVPEEQEERMILLDKVVSKFNEVLSLSGSTFQLNLPISR